MNRASLGAVFFCAGVAALLGCDADRGRVRSEAGALANSIGKVRSAPNEGKRPLLKALEAKACTADDLCALKEICVEAYTLHLQGTDSIAAVRGELEDHSALITPKAAALLEGARASLEKAKTLTEQCAQREGEAVREYGL